MHFWHNWRVQNWETCAGTQRQLNLEFHVKSRAVSVKLRVVPWRFPSFLSRPRPFARTRSRVKLVDCQETFRLSPVTPKQPMFPKFFKLWLDVLTLGTWNWLSYSYKHNNVLCFWSWWCKFLMGGGRTLLTMLLLIRQWFSNIATSPKPQQTPQSPDRTISDHWQVACRLTGVHRRLVLTMRGNTHSGNGEHQCCIKLWWSNCVVTFVQDKRHPHSKTKQFQPWNIRQPEVTLWQQLCFQNSAFNKYPRLFDVELCANLHPRRGTQTRCHGPKRRRLGRAWGLTEPGLEPVLWDLRHPSMYHWHCEAWGLAVREVSWNLHSFLSYVPRDACVFFFRGPLEPRLKRSYPCA